MKKHLILLIIFSSSILTGQIINFPDANLKDALINHATKIDINGDGEIQETEAKAFNLRINIQSNNIENLAGLEYFINVDTLFAGFNNYSNVEFSTMPWLTHLDFSNNFSLESLDINALTQLKFLNLSSCWKLEDLDFSKNKELRELRLFGLNSDILELDLSQQDKLEYIQVQSMDGLKEIQWGSTEKLQWIDISKTKISHLNYTELPALRFLYGRNTLLREIDAWSNTALEQVFCDNNSELSMVNLKNGRNQILSDIDLTGNIKLKTICVDDVEAAKQNQRWQIDDSAEYVDNCQTSTKEIKEGDISIYPVPADEYLNISGIDQPIRIDVYNINGRLMQSMMAEGSTKTIDVSNLERGYYILKISLDGQNIIFKRFVKLHY